MTLSLFSTKARRRGAAIAALEHAITRNDKEAAESEERLLKKFREASQELDRQPIAGALVWKGRKDA